MTFDVKKAAVDFCDCGEAGDEHDNVEGHLQWCAMFPARKWLAEAHRAGLEEAISVVRRNESMMETGDCISLMEQIRARIASPS
jgi:hypothetical protein